MSAKAGGATEKRTGGRALGIARVARKLFVGLLAALVVVTAARTSWNASQDAFRDNREQGTLVVQACGRETCSGTFVPRDGGKARTGAVIEKSVVRRTGQRVRAAVRPGTKTVVRAGPVGVLDAFVPFGGALLLASVLLAGGLGLRRVAAGCALGGGLLIGAAFLTL